MKSRYIYITLFYLIQLCGAIDECCGCTRAITQNTILGPYQSAAQTKLKKLLGQYSRQHQPQKTGTQLNSSCLLTIAYIYIFWNVLVLVFHSIPFYFASAYLYANTYIQTIRQVVWEHI